MRLDTKFYRLMLAAGLVMGPRYPESLTTELLELSGAGLRLYVLDCGSTRIWDKSIFHAGYENEPFDIEVRCFLVMHPRGVLLWDAGHPDAVVGALPNQRPEGVLFSAAIRRPLLEQFASIGLDAEDVDFIAFSHWHADHTGNANRFSNATVLGQRDEYELAFSERAADSFGMKPSTYAKLADNPADLFIGDRDVFGDGTVRILRAPGHTVGSQVLYVGLESPILLSGDLYHFAEQRHERRVPPFNHSRVETLASFQKIEAFLAKSDATIWITHDPQQMSSVDIAPKFYE